MNHDQLSQQRKEVGWEIERRRSQGGYSVDAPSILDLYVHMHKMIDHLMEREKTIDSLNEQLDALRGKKK